VRTSESACPFCRAKLSATEAAGAGLGASRGPRSLREIAASRASRAALFAGAVLVAGCSNSTEPADGDDAGQGDDDGGVAQPVYGAPVGTDGGVAKDEAGIPIAQPVYGGAIHPDAG
jgi:hypothetical protein